MSPEGLNVVLESGRKGRREYYKERVDDFRVDQIHCLAKSMANVPHGEPAKYKKIISSRKQDYGEK